MFDFSFSELLVVAVVTLVVLGPKEIPVVLRYVRGMIRSVRETSDSLRRQLDDVLEMDELKQTVKSATTFIQGDDGKLYEAYNVEDLRTVSAPDANLSSEIKEAHDQHPTP
jgi:sec-independent protein translocase protein TatB